MEYFSQKGMEAALQQLDVYKRQRQKSPPHGQGLRCFAFMLPWPACRGSRAAPQVLPQGVPAVSYTHLIVDL